MHEDLRWVELDGYVAPKRCGQAGVCAVRRYLYTGALVTGIGPIDHAGRYCYASVDEAKVALAEWNGEGDPPGHWIKFKGACSERLGPGALAEPAMSK